MTQCNTKTRVDFHPQSPIDIEFSADDISTDGGAVLLRQAEEHLGICDTISRMVPDERDPLRTAHSRKQQVLQRVLQLALGYEDQNDADSLRDDPILKASCDVDPDKGRLSSQPTLSRFENACTENDILRMQWKLALDWLHSLDEDRRQITIDIDSTPMEGHGEQEELFYCDHFRGYKLHPLMLFDGETGQLITVVLRPGNAGDSADIEDWIPCLVMALKHLHRQDCSVVVRADAGFATPRLYDALDRLDRLWGPVGYLIGFRKNSVVKGQLEPAMETARRLQKQQKKKARVFTSFSYRANSWKQARTIVGKAEVTEQGDNPRFVVTNFEQIDPRLLYEIGYCGRGRCEQWIGEYKNGLFGDRISCHEFEANGFRTILAALAYRLMFFIQTQLRRLAADQKASAETAERCRQMARATFCQLRLRLLKVAFIVRRSVRRIYLQGAQSFPMADVFHHVARAMH